MIKSTKIEIYKKKEKLKVQHQFLLEEQQSKKQRNLQEIKGIKSKEDQINKKIKKLVKQASSFQLTIDNLRQERNQFTKQLSELHKQIIIAEKQIQQISKLLKINQNYIEILQQKADDINKISQQENTIKGTQSSNKQKQKQYGKQLILIKQQVVEKKEQLVNLQLKLFELRNKVKQIITLTETNGKRSEEGINQIKEINENISKLSNSAQLLQKETIYKQSELKQIEKENKISAEKRADLISCLPKLHNDEILFISNEGLQYILNHFDAQNPQKNFNWVSDYRVELPIKLKKSGPGSKQPRTLIDVWNQTVIKFGDRPALTFQSQPNNWKSYTFQEYYNNSLRFGKACISVGLTNYSIVMIMGFNSPEWAFSFYGAMFARYLPVGIYTTNSSDACQYIANHSEGQLVVVQNEIQLKKYYNIVDKCPTIKYFVVYKENISSNLPQRMKGKVFTWKQFMTLGDKFTPAKKEDDIKYRQSIQKPGNCATLIYTSGTTGMPKAVMASHDNYIFEIDGIHNQMTAMGRPSLQGKGRVLSYLPFSHVAAQLFDLIGPVKFGFNLYFPDSSVLQANLLKFLNVAKPTLFFGVPRVWEKIQEKLGQILSDATGFKKKIFQWAMSIGIEGSFAEILNKPTPHGWSIAKKIFYNKIKQNLGLDQCEYFMFGAAPMKQKTRKFFLQLNILINNGYGMSESSGPHTFTQINKWKSYNKNFLKEAGSVTGGGQIGLQDQDQEGKGQICLRGRNVFMGYFKNEEETKRTLDKNGFLHSGDEGMLDQNNNLYITGRLKELIVTAGGENIPPVLIQNEITTALPIVSQAVVIGDFKKYLTVLLCLKVKNNEELTDEVCELIKKHGSQAKTISQAIKCNKVNEYIMNGLKQTNQKAISNAHKVQKYTILPRQFTIESGLLTPTMKIKRKVVHEIFKAQIQSMYINPKI